MPFDDNTEREPSHQLRDPLCAPQAVDISPAPLTRLKQPSRHPAEYGEKRWLASSTRSGLLRGGKARWGQAGRSQILQPAPIGVAAEGWVRSRPSE